MLLFSALVLPTSRCLSLHCLKCQPAGTSRGAQSKTGTWLPLQSSALGLGYRKLPSRVPRSRQLFVPRECSREPWREHARNKGVPSQLGLVVSLPSKHHLCPGGQGGSSTPTQGGKTCHLPSLVAPRVTQKGWFPRPLKRGCFCRRRC